MPQVQDLFVKVTYGSVIRNDVITTTLHYSFSDETSIDVAIQLAKSLSQGLFEDSEQILRVTTYYDSPELMTWNHKNDPRYMDALLYSGYLTVKENQGYTLRLGSDYQNNLKITHCYVITPDDSVFIAELDPELGCNYRSVEWWEWQFNQFIETFQKFM
jgi:hypothetical protein